MVYIKSWRSTWKTSSSRHTGSALNPCCFYGGELPMLLAPLTGFEAFILQTVKLQRWLTNRKKKQNNFWEASKFHLSPQNTQPFHPEKPTWAKKKKIVTTLVKTWCVLLSVQFLPRFSTAVWKTPRKQTLPVIATRSNVGRSNPLASFPGWVSWFCWAGSWWFLFMVFHHHQCLKNAKKNTHKKMIGIFFEKLFEWIGENTPMIGKIKYGNIGKRGTNTKTLR